MISALPGKGSVSFSFLSVVAGEDLAPFDFVTILPDEKAYKTTQPTLDPTRPYLVGVVLEAAIATNPVVIQVSGKITNPAWVFTPGVPLYLDSLGAISETQPITGLKQIIGHALTANTIFIQNFFGSGASAGVEIYDGATFLTNTALKYKFSGPNIKAVLSAPGEVTIYSPPPVNVSHFNTYDAIGDASVNNVPTSSRAIAAPSAPGVPFDIGDWIPDSQHPATNSGILTFFVANPFSILDNTTTIFTATVYGADGSTILAQNVLNPIVGDTVQTLNNITITISGFAQDADLVKYVALVSVQIDIATILPQGGRFTVYLEHNNQIEGLFTKTQGPLFYDSNNTAATLAGVTIQETPLAVVIKELSGAKYYTTDSQFTTAIADIDSINDRSYPAIQVQHTAPNYGLPQLDLPGAVLAGWNPAFDNANASFNKSDWKISAPNFFYLGAGAKASARTADWVYGSFVDSPNAAIQVDTYGNNGNRIFEDFNVEAKRLKSDFTAWDSSQSLATFDGGTGLQFINSRLMYPSINHTLYNPQPLIQPNYLGLTGNKVAFIPFYKINQSFSNGKVQLSDHNITEADLVSGLVKFHISLDLVNWYDLTQDYLGGALFNNSGCRINVSTINLTINSQIEFTFGTGKFTSATTGAAPNNWGAVLRVTYYDQPGITTKYIGGLNFISWV